MAAADLVERLIKEFKKKTLLFDKSNGLYKDSIKKRDMWNFIGSRLGITGKRSCTSHAYILYAS